MPTELGTRHRAGIGITENSDAISIIVSEETGIISSANDGKLTRYLDGKALEKILLEIYFNNEEKSIIGSVKSAFDKIEGLRMLQNRKVRIIVALIMSVCLWAYVTGTIDPTITKNTIQCPLQLSMRTA